MAVLSKRNLSIDKAVLIKISIRKKLSLKAHQKLSNLSSLSSKFASLLLHLVRAAISDRELINKWVCGCSVLESYSPSNFTECSGSGVLSEKTDFGGHLRYEGRA